MNPFSDHAAPTEHAILDLFAERWSTRIFDAAAPLDEDAFASALEAARWAPSAGNTQPWRAIVARRGTAEHRAVFDTLMGFNQEWAGRASALVAFCAQTATEDGEPLAWGVYDTGQAAAYFTIQAHAGGLAAHQMGGFHRDRLAAAFDLEGRFEPVTVVAVGMLGDPSEVSEKVRAREATPRTRRPIRETVLVDA